MNTNTTMRPERPCDCSTCTRANCIHRGAFRRLPRDLGGLDLCMGWTHDEPTAPTVEKTVEQDETPTVETAETVETARTDRAFTQEVERRNEFCMLCIHSEDCSRRYEYIHHPRDLSGCTVCSRWRQIEMSDEEERLLRKRLAGDDRETDTQESETVVNVETENPMEILSRAYLESVKRYGLESDETVEPLLSLARAVAYSVLCKCRSVLMRPQKDSDRKTRPLSTVRVLSALRVDIARATSDALSASYNEREAFSYGYDKNGEYKREVKDGDAKRELDRIASETLGDGVDLVHEAVVAILAETQKQIERGDDLGLFNRYSDRRVVSRVRGIDVKHKNLWKTVETYPMRESFSAVRRAISSSRAVGVDPRSKYIYLEDVTTDPETGEKDTYFIRLGKCANLGGYATDINGRVDYSSPYSADPAVVEAYERAVERMRLTPLQKNILRHLQSGETQGEIANALQISENSVKSALREIRRKAVAVGLTPRGLAVDEYGESTEKK